MARNLAEDQPTPHKFADVTATLAAKPDGTIIALRVRVLTLPVRRLLVANGGTRRAQARWATVMRARCTSS